MKAQKVAKPGKHPGGRPKGSGSKLKEETVKLLELGARLGGSILLCCEYAGIHPDTFYEWWHKGERGETADYKSFTERIKKARAAKQIKVLARLDKAGEKVWQADAWFLERYDRENWGRYERVDVKLSKEDILAAIDVARAAGAEGADELTTEDVGDVVREISKGRAR